VRTGPPSGTGIALIPAEPLGEGEENTGGAKGRRRGREEGEGGGLGGVGGGVGGGREEDTS